MEISELKVKEASPSFYRTIVLVHLKNLAKITVQTNTENYFPPKTPSTTKSAVTPYPLYN